MQKSTLIAVVLSAKLVGCASARAGASPAPQAPVISRDARAGAPPKGRPLVAVTYNLHTGLGSEPRLMTSAQRAIENVTAVAETIATANGSEPPDVIALNEIDFGSDRTGRIDEAQVVADEVSRRTGVKYELLRLETWRSDFPGMRVRYGSALLSRHPVQSHFTCLLVDGAVCEATAATGAQLPALTVRSIPMLLGGERRGVLKATIDVDGAPVDVLVTHLEAFNHRDREAQAAHLISRFVTEGRSTILLGDMNSVPQSFPDRGWFDGDLTQDVLTSGALVDARLAILARDPSRSPASFATFPSTDPKSAIDGIYASVDLVPVAADRIGEKASDHLGVLGRFVLLEDDAELNAATARHDEMRDRQLHRVLDWIGSEGARARADTSRFVVEATRFLDVSCPQDRARLSGYLGRGGEALVSRIAAGRASPGAVAAGRAADAVPPG